MTAIVLAAGQGQRLKPLTNDRPKGMVEIAGQTIIQRQLRMFRRAGITEVAIVKGFCADSVPDYGCRHYVNHKYATTNMVASLFCAEKEFDSGATVVVSYGDILYSDGVLAALLEADAAVSVVVDLEWKPYFSQRFDDPYDDAESLVLDHGGFIRSIGQTNPRAADVQAQYIGLIKFDPTGLAFIRQIRDEMAAADARIGWGRPWRQAYMTDLLQELIQRGTRVNAVPIRGNWCEIDSLRDYEIAERAIASFSRTAGFVRSF
jgi:choline kinase